MVNLLEDDDGPHTPEDVASPEMEKTEQDERTQRERRASLDEMREDVVIRGKGTIGSPMI